MILASRVSIASSVAILAAGSVICPAHATDWTSTHLRPAVQAWMGVVTLLAEDDDREEGRRRPERERSEDQGRRDRRGPPRPEGPRGEAITMLNDIVGRLSRIEAMLGGRGPMMGPPPGWREGHAHGDHGHHPRRGQGRPEMTPEMRDKMEARMEAGRDRMRAAREKWENASEEERAEMKQSWEKRMKEDRGTMAEATARMEQARKRFQQMEERVEQLEAEVARLKKAAREDD